MKKFILLALLVVGLTSCKKESSTTAYTISGTTKNSKDQTKVEIYTLKNRKPLALQDTVIKNNQFFFKGSIDTLNIYYLKVDKVAGARPFILENANLQFEVDTDTIIKTKITGGKENAIFSDYLNFNFFNSNKLKALTSKIKTAKAEKDQEKIKVLKKEYKQLVDEKTAFDEALIKNNPDRIFSAFLLQNIVNANKINLKKTTELYNAFTDRVKNSEPGKEIHTGIIAKEQTKIGALAPNFTGKTPEGKELSLNAIKGKVTIIDFWASWCGPCRKENPNVVALYNTYHDKGLEIIGVSLDGSPRQKNAKDAWIAAIQQDKLAWYQVSNLQYFNDPIAKAYNIKGIPSTFILDADGKILAKNLRGKVLENKIAELLN